MARTLIRTNASSGRRSTALVALSAVAGLAVMAIVAPGDLGSLTPHPAATAHDLQASSRPLQLATATPTETLEPYPYVAIASAPTALAVSYSELWPAGVSTTTHTAKLITHARFETAWLAWPTADVGDLVDWPPSTGVWLVGIGSSSLQAPTVAAAFGMTDPDTSAVDGMFMAWDANSGLLRSAGVIDSHHASRNMTAIAALPTDSVSIGTPTP